MTDGGFDRVDGNVVCVGAERLLEGAGFNEVVVRQAISVSIDVI